MNLWLLSTIITFLLAITTAWMCSRMEINRSLPKSKNDLVF